MYRKLTIKEKRDNFIDKTLPSLKVYKDSCGSVQRVLLKLNKLGFMPEASIDSLLQEFYGMPNTEKDKTVLTILTLMKVLDLIPRQRYDEDEYRSRGILWNNVKKQLIECFNNEYKFSFKQEDQIYHVEPLITQKIIENIEDSSLDEVDDFKELISMTGDSAKLAGHVNNIYKLIDKIPKEKISNLTGPDATILKKSQELAKLMRSKIVAHATDSKLSVNDIAHSFAFNASLVLKILEKYKEDIKK